MTTARALVELIMTSGHYLWGGVVSVSMRKGVFPDDADACKERCSGEVGKEVSSWQSRAASADAPAMNSYSWSTDRPTAIMMIMLICRDTPIRGRDGTAPRFGCTISGWDASWAIIEFPTYVRCIKNQVRGGLGRI